LWILFHYSFIKLFKFKEIAWIRLDYIWLSIGFLAVLTIIEENKKRYSQQELSFVKTWIDRDYEDLISISKLQNNCIQFQHNPLLHSKDEFALIQSRQDSICNWTKMIYVKADSCFRNGQVAILNLPKYEISTSGNDYPCDRIKELIKTINENVNKRAILDSRLSNNFWSGFKSGLGVIFLFIAFALRLTIISYKVKKEKTRHNNGYN